MKSWFLLGIALLAVGLVSANPEEVCSMVGGGGYAVKDCFITNTFIQRNLTANGVTGAFCSFDDQGNNCCAWSNGSPGGICVQASQVVNILPPFLYSCAAPQPATVTACPRCGVVCVASSACAGQTDGCSLCKRVDLPVGSPAEYRCSASAKRDDVCLNDEGVEISC